MPLTDNYILETSCYISLRNINPETLEVPSFPEVVFGIVQAGNVQGTRCKSMDPNMASNPEMIEPGRYRHYKGKEYEVIGMARHSETRELMVVYRALYGEGGMWVRPAAMFAEDVVIAGKTLPRFARLPTGG
jgi:hypothetical protein